jgi:acetoin utilization deacetylase AcuC-like enzyme
VSQYAAVETHGPPNAALARIDAAASAALSRRALIAGAAARATIARAATPTTLFLSHPAMRGHDPGPGWPDAAARVDAIATALDAPAFSTLARAAAPRAEGEDLLRAHSAGYLARFEKATPAEGRVAFGADAVMSAGTREAALRAAGGAASAVDHVMRGATRNAFVACRPPGHHARADAAMGFCFFNNAAVAARRALARGAERVAIVDFDAHHGNGLQEIFWSDRSVLYCSTHQAPHYPGTGAVGETGEHDNIVNAPLRKGDGGVAFREALAARILPRLDAFAPDLLLVCAGFDAHLHDPLGGLRFVAADYRDATLRLMEIAARRCGGRIVSLLEGGYNPPDLAASATAHVAALMEA